ncbi:MAG: hypothetical protein ACRBB3_03300 [Alphaproteobacteria bacterium]
MTNLSDNFGSKASGLPSFEIQGMFGQLASVSDGYNPEQAVSFDNTLDNSM